MGVGNLAHFMYGIKEHFFINSRGLKPEQIGLSPVAALLTLTIAYR